MPLPIKSSPCTDASCVTEGEIGGELFDGYQLLTSQVEKDS